MDTPELAVDEGMAVVFRSSNHDAEMEANVVHGILESAGINATVTGATMIPSLEFLVQVPEHELDEAQRILAAGKAEGAAVAVPAQE